MEDKEPINVEDVAMQIIASAGDERSCAFQSLQYAKKGDFEKAEAMMKEADKAGNQAHKIQFELLTRYANGEKIDENVLLVHAQDHVMCAQLAHELIGEINQLYKDRNKTEKGKED